MLKAIDKENIPDKGLGLVDVTKLANKVIQGDIADLIEKTVDPEKADYAVITGIQIHSTRVANSKDGSKSSSLSFLREKEEGTNQKETRRLSREIQKGNLGCQLAVRGRGPEHEANTR
ncbi:unnamed protein product [Bathycoccus prasinos]